MTLDRFRHNLVAMYSEVRKSRNMLTTRHGILTTSQKKRLLTRIRKMVTTSQKMLMSVTADVTHVRRNLLKADSAREQDTLLKADSARE